VSEPVRSKVNSTHLGEVIQTRTQRGWLRADGILQFECLPGAEMHLADAEENNKTALYLTGGRALPALINIINIKSISKEARDYYSSDATKEAESAVAMLLGSPVSRVIGNFFLGLNRSVVPTRLFTSELEAIQWLKGFLEK
jgi:hypothetical protein